MALFGLIKPAHHQMRATLTPADAAAFDRLLASYQDSIPTHWSKGGRERAMAIIMGEWIGANYRAGKMKLSPVMAMKVDHLAKLASEFNDRDHRGDGSQSSAYAHDILRAMREADIVPS